MKKIIALLLTAAFCLCLTGCSSLSNYSTYSFDETDMELIQFETPEEDAPVAKISTSLGDVWVVLYPDEAPNACENFTMLAEDGWYDGTEFFRIEPEVACIGGSKTNDGNTPSTVYNDEQFANEYSMNLWPFSGALCTISDTDGMSDSRFFILAETPSTEEYSTSMIEYGFPQAVQDKFAEVGGEPPFTQRYTVFGQTVKGQEVVNEIVLTEVNEDQYPTGDPIEIISITMTTYGEIEW